MDALSRFFAMLLLGGVLLLNPSTSRADIIWDWSFANEAGTFTTDGNLVGNMAPAATYAILEFVVTASDFAANLGSLSGGQYFESQPTNGFIWDGFIPTQFFRNGGSLTNGSVFVLASAPGQFYGFNPAANANSSFRDDQERFTEGPLSLDPRTAPIPEPSTMLLLGTGLAGLAAWRWRTRASR